MRRSSIFGTLVVFFISLFLTTNLAGGERLFSWTQAPARGDYIGVNLSPYQLSRYLAECQVNRPEIVNEVKSALEKGEFYRKSTIDQRGKGVRLTVNVNPDYMLRIVTWRNETCPTCKGTGKRDAPFDKFSKRVSVTFACLECNGKGYLENHTTERYFMLSSENFENPEEGRQIMAQRNFAGAPRDAERWVERLPSKNPMERLDACIWLDENYVRVGDEFQRIMPMLKKARYHEANNKRRVMVWQFWAGKDLPNERGREYYRIYADTRSGKITKKGFYPG